MVTLPTNGKTLSLCVPCLVRAALLSAFFFFPPHQRDSSCSPSCQDPAYRLVGHISMWRTHQLLGEAGDLSRGARCRVGKTAPLFPRAADIWRKAITLAALPPPPPAAFVSFMGVVHLCKSCGSSCEGGKCNFYLHIFPRTSFFMSKDVYFKRTSCFEMAGFGGVEHKLICEYLVAGVCSWITCVGICSASHPAHRRS